MYFSKFAIHNYKSFNNTEPISLARGINVVVGRNNSGKTAFLEALSLDFSANPHRSLITLPKPGAYLEPNSYVDIWFTVASSELKEILLRPDVEFRLPRPRPSTEFYQSLRDPRNGSEDAVPDRLLEFFLSHELTFRVRWQRGPKEKLDIPEIPSFFLSSSPAMVPLYEAAPRSGDGRFQFFHYRNQGTGKISPGASVEDGNVEVAGYLFGMLKHQLFRFVAERYNVGVFPVGDKSVLGFNAGNLPEVLHNLRSNPNRFQRYKNAVRTILPEIKEITLRSNSANQVEIMIWPIDAETERPDLAVSLSESGTGIGQVLAILYVVMYYSDSRIILIDEPQTFLHPGALRKLVQTIKQYPQHQYIVSTHSTGVLSSATPDVVIDIRQTEGRSEIRALEKISREDLQLYLAELGASLSDVFGADNVVWVEGLTEGLCYPKVLQRISNRSLMGTVIIPVRSTGEFGSKKDAEHIVDIYNRLSASSALIPPAISFVFDGECHDLEKRREIIRRSGGKAVFIPRRMYECYLLNPHAITAVANAIEGFRSSALEVGEVAHLLEAKCSSAEYYCDGAIPSDATEKVKKINAAKVLHDMFAELSDTRVTFDKVEHTVKLTDWIISNSPKDLSELSTFLVEEVLERQPVPK